MGLSESQRLETFLRKNWGLVVRLSKQFCLPLSDVECYEDIKAGAMCAYFEAVRYMHPRKGVRLEGLFGNFLKTEFKALYKKYNGGFVSDDSLLKNLCDEDEISDAFYLDGMIVTDGLYGHVSIETINLLNALSAKILPNGKTRRRFICEFIGRKASQLKAMSIKALRELSAVRLDRYKALCEDGAVYVIWAESDEMAEEIAGRYGKIIEIEKLKKLSFTGVNIGRRRKTNNLCS